MGAIIGSSIGRIKWPGGSSRTLEGSFAMFISMIFAIYNFNPEKAFRLSTIFGLIQLTLLEAVTFSIDNLVIPIFSTIVFILME